MKNKYFSVIALSALALSLSASAAPTKKDNSLEEELNTLKLPRNDAPAGVKEEKLYSVQTRYLPLTYKSEAYVSGAMNLTPGSFVSSQQADLGYRFHFNDRFSLGVNGSYVFNGMSDAGNKLIEQDDTVPDLAYVKYRFDMTAGLNVFYGKFRLTMNHVFYFDQYITIGPGMVMLSSGNSMAAVGDIGFVFWLGQSVNARIGLKDYFFHEKRIKSEGLANHLLWHVDVGFLFGGAGT